MKSKRLPENSYQMNQSLAKLVVRGGLGSEPSVSGQSHQADEFKQAVAKCFGQSDDEYLTLKDEFSAKTIEVVVSKCRELLGELPNSRECWQKMGEFLDDELWDFSRLKEELAQAEKEVSMVQGKLSEAAAPLDGQVNQRRVMACAMLLAEKEMRRDHFQDRVSMIIDQFVGRILAGTQNEPGGEVLELRLRGVFGAL